MISLLTTVLLAIGCVAEIAWAVLPALRRRTTATWIRKQRLPAAPGLADVIDRARAGRVLAQGLGGLFGLGVGLLVLPTPTVADVPQLGMWLLIVTTSGGIAVGLGAYVWGAALPLPSGTTRVAHATDQSVVLLLGPALLGLARGTVVLGLLAGVFVAVFPAGPASGLPQAFGNAVLVGVAVLLVTWLVAEVLAARLMHRPQPAGSAAELAWHDVLRAELARDLYVLPCTLALYLALLGVLQQESGSAAPSLPLPLGVVPLGLMVVILVALVVQVLLRAGATRPTRHWRERLAPDPTGTVR